MATATTTALPGLAGDELPVDLTSDLFFAMIDAGVFPRDRRVFLWEGRLCEKMAKTVPHATTSVRIHEALHACLPVGWLIWPENPIALDARHAPLPDIPVVRGPVGLYDLERRHPQPGDVGLIVEIAVSSLAKDLGERAEKYARALVPAYWVADVVTRRLVEHAGPRIIEGVGSYSRVESHAAEGEIPLVLDGREIALLPVAELLPGPGLRP